jgi:hypothetical protein
MNYKLNKRFFGLRRNLDGSYDFFGRNTEKLPHKFILLSAGKFTICGVFMLIISSVFEKHYWLDMNFNRYLYHFIMAGLVIGGLSLILSDWLLYRKMKRLP